MKYTNFKMTVAGGEHYVGGRSYWAGYVDVLSEVADPAYPGTYVAKTPISAQFPRAQFQVGAVRVTLEYIPEVET